MTLARLLPAALIVCSLPAFGQEQQTSNLPAFPASGHHDADVSVVSRDSGRAFDTSRATPATAGEPWRIAPNLTADLGSEKYNIGPDQFTVDLQGPYFKSGAHSRPLVLRADGQGADLTCYTIRSYVVARDSKDSDSTHPAGYSTCRPSDRYQVKSAEFRVVADH